ncbi:MULTISPECIES: MgtC/SapB family protein [unclassified Polynucleobacter]|uniref:MgtC/SapB family protein n=1 Tax=unclassified Polynucleobacter TaxID=2640945 RepID=UPI001F20BA65|nr:MULTISPECIES: MgtC/SapB family protein [unclassified Polynucleobacter]MCE7528273.1 MgtC/SapB family protein [Polynucleobacter sp. IMCC 30228]MCE7530186.1 MgtC/SapB family protein [Polynucleobacter sp. IMCC 29146]
MDQTSLLITTNLLTSLIAGGIIGMERSLHGRPAGFRTHALVCLASSLLMSVTAFQSIWITVDNSELFRTDPTRMAQGIMTGIGFLGAGVIFKKGLNVRGLTTAASIWITAAIGILFGIGFYFPAIIATVLALVTLSLFRWIEAKIPSHHYVNNTITYSRDKTPSQIVVKELLSKHGFKVEGISYQLIGDGSLFQYKMTIRTNDSSNLIRLSECLIGLVDVKHFEILPTGD